MLAYFKRARRQTPEWGAGVTAFAAVGMLVTTLAEVFLVSGKPFECYEFRCFSELMIAAAIATPPVNAPDFVAVVSVEAAPDRARIEADLRRAMAERPNHKTVLIGVEDGISTQNVIDVIDICRGLGLTASVMVESGP